MAFLDDMRRHRESALAERAEHVAWVEKLDARIAALNMLIEQETATPQAAVSETDADAERRAERRRRFKMTLGAAIVAVMQHYAGQPVTFPDLVKGVEDELGAPVNEKSVRGTLPRLEEVENVGRGVYRLREIEGATDADAALNDSGPAAEAGPEEATQDESPSQGGVLVGATQAPQPAA